MRIRYWCSDVCSSDLADAAAAGGSLDHCWGLVEGKAKCAVLLAVLSGNAQDAEEFLTESVQTLSGRPAVPTRDARPTPARPPSEHDGLWNADAHVPQIGRAHVCTPVTNAHLVCRL